MPWIIHQAGLHKSGCKSGAQDELFVCLAQFCLSLDYRVADGMGVIIFLVLCLDVLGYMCGGNSSWGE